MKKIVVLSALTLTAASLIGCASTPSSTFADESAGTVAVVKAAGKVGYEWRDTGKLIKDAEAAYNAGDKDKAAKLLKKAQEQGQIAQMQAKEQANAKPWYNM
jgi:uncharacterized OsmC-like protein